MHATASACSTRAILLRPPRLASVFPPLHAGRRPDLGGEWPQLSEHPAWRSRQGPEVVAAPHDDSERRGAPAARQDSGGWDQVDRQLADWRELRQQQRGRVSYPNLLMLVCTVNVPQCNQQSITFWEIKPFLSNCIYFGFKLLSTSK